MLVKLINGEKATFQTPTFSRKRERTLEMLIKDLYEEYAHDTKMVSSFSSLNFNFIQLAHPEAATCVDVVVVVVADDGRYLLSNFLVVFVSI